MRSTTWENLISGGYRFPDPVSLTIGVFDGVHLGHRKLLSEVISGPGISLVVTFAESPALVLSRGSFPGPIMTFRQKLRTLEALGVEATVSIDFSEQLSRLSGKAFIALLKENLSIRKVAVGYNFRFGRDKDADADALRKMFSRPETEVSVTEPILYKGSAVSSSRIRACIREGALGEARAMLGAAHSLDLRDVHPLPHCDGDSRIMRIRKIDIRQCLPDKGSYPVSCEAETAAVSGQLTVREDVVELELEACGKITKAIFLSD
jgi:riboflavin kinase / FMN adenylyltransferase